MAATLEATTRDSRGKNEARRLRAAGRIPAVLYGGADGAVALSVDPKVLSRILKPNRGSYHIDGRLTALIEVGAGFHPDLTGRENIYLNGTILGMTRQEIKQREEAIIDFAAIDGFIDTPVKRYSSGMGARLGFAIAAHLRTDVLLVDEVRSVGDARFRHKCIAHMNRLLRSGITPLEMPGLPTHVKGLVEALAEYQQAAADAAWSGDARDGVRALAAHPLVRSVDAAEALYAELAAAHRQHLPARLVPA